MEESDANYSNYDYPDPLIKLRELEEKEKLLKDRVVLIGNNLIETKEESTKKILELKKDVEIIKDNLERIRKFLETIAEEFSKFASKEDVEILAKQARMFNPID